MTLEIEKSASTTPNGKDDRRFIVEDLLADVGVDAVRADQEVERAARTAFERNGDAIRRTLIDRGNAIGVDKFDRAAAGLHQQLAQIVAEDFDVFAVEPPALYVRSSVR